MAINDGKSTGIGMVLRGDDRKCVACRTMVVEGAQSSGEAEAIGLLEALSVGIYGRRSDDDYHDDHTTFQTLRNKTIKQKHTDLRSSPNVSYVNEAATYIL